MFKNFAIIHTDLCQVILIYFSLTIILLTSNKIILTYFLQVTKIMISNTNSLHKNMATLNKKLLAVLVSCTFFF